MQPRTPTFLWIPFVFSIGTISWALLILSLVLLSAVVITPAVADLRQSQATRNDYLATLELLDQKIALQNDFLASATRDPVLMERLAARQLNLNRKDQEILILDPAAAYKDRSVESLLAESLTPTHPRPVPSLPAPFSYVLLPAMRQFMILVACAAMALSFFLGVKFERA